MVKINLRDKNFGGNKSSCHLRTNKYVEWETGNERVSNSCFITDLCLPDVLKAKNVKRKIAWLLEPYAINPHMYEWIKSNNRLFDFVMTYDENLVDMGENYLFYPFGMCWINEFNNEPKDQLCSIIASSKNFTIGHQLRHEIISRYKSLSVYGNGYKPIDKKELALNNYKFSIVVENCQQPGFWTEKIVDCFATKTIPIYWGTKSVNKFFDANGILQFDTLEGLETIINDITNNGNEIYQSKIAAIEHNFQEYTKYMIPEDWMYVTYPFLFT